MKRTLLFALSFLTLVASTAARADWCDIDCFDHVKVCFRDPFPPHKKHCNVNPALMAEYNACKLAKATVCAVKAVKQPFYGHYCGKGDVGGAPIDDLDAACMRHDRCYEKRGDHNCACDLELSKEACRIWADPHESARERQVAQQVCGLFGTAVTGHLCR